MGWCWGWDGDGAGGGLGMGWCWGWNGAKSGMVLRVGRCQGRDAEQGHLATQGYGWHIAGALHSPRCWHCPQTLHVPRTGLELELCTLCNKPSSALRKCRSVKSRKFMGAYLLDKLLV